MEKVKKVRARKRKKEELLAARTAVKKCEFVGCEEVVVGEKSFCSKKCINLWRWGATTKEGKLFEYRCTVCDKLMATCRAHRPGRSTCSDECEHEARSRVHRNKIVSEETRQKMSEFRRGRTLSEEHRRAIGRGVAGEKNRYWIDGRSMKDDDYNGEFTHWLRLDVKRRDNFTCQECLRHESDISDSKIAGKLVVHHIDWVKTNNWMDNLMTLCFSCHSKVHTSLSFHPRHESLVKYSYSYEAFRRTVRKGHKAITGREETEAADG